jgi:hypothetical protein
LRTLTHHSAISNPAAATQTTGFSVLKTPVFCPQSVRVCSVWYSKYRAFPWTAHFETETSFVSCEETQSHNLTTVCSKCTIQESIRTASVV